MVDISTGVVDLAQHPKALRQRELRRTAVFEAFDRYGSLVYALARGMVDDQARAEWIVERTFLEVCSEGVGPPGAASLPGRLLAHARRCCDDMLDGSCTAVAARPRLMPA